MFIRSFVLRRNGVNYVIDPACGAQTLQLAGPSGLAPKSR
jgi:hypothetical protein